MSSIQVYKIQFLANNPFGSFVTGDVLDIFIETDDAVVPAAPLSFEGTGISVNLNGVSYPALGSGVILDFGPSIVSIQQFNPQICIGTSLLVFSLFSAWPYSTYYSLENHYSCTINPPTCNLIINGVPIVVPASDEVTADGSIQVMASSSNVIEYNLGSDFVFGEGQAENIFSGLLPGSYRIYLRDSANCAATVLVEVNFSNTYGPKYRLEYTDNNSQLTRIDIAMRGYAGSVFEICGTGTPFEVSLRGEGSQDKFEALLSSQSNLNLVSETDLKFLELYTNDPNLYRIYYYKDLGVIQPGGSALEPLSDWTNDDESGTLTGESWTLGATPTVSLTDDENSIWLASVTNLLNGLHDLDYDIDVTDNCRILFALFSSGVQSGSILIIPVIGSNIGTLEIDSTGIIDEIKVRVLRETAGLPVLADWLNFFEVSRVAWTLGATPTVSLNGTASQAIYANYDFIEGQNYTIQIDLSNTDQIVNIKNISSFADPADIAWPSISFTRANLGSASGITNGDSARFFSSVNYASGLVVEVGSGYFIFQHSFAGNETGVTAGFVKGTSTVQFTLRDDSFFITLPNSPIPVQGLGFSGSYSYTYTFTAPSDSTKFAIQITSTTGQVDFTLDDVQITNALTGTCDITINDLSITIPEISGLQAKLIHKVLPQQYAEEYKAPPYYASVVGTDALAELKNYFLIQNDGQKYAGTISLIKLVAYCLKFLKLELNICVACNLYADTMNQAASDDPFDQAYVDFEAFYLAEKEPTLEFVLKSILDPWGARITQWDTKWQIIRVEEMVSSYDFREFDKDGNYLTNGTRNPVINIKYPDDSLPGEDVLLANRDHNLEIRPGYGRIKAIYALGLKPNILSNGDFRLNSVYSIPDNTYFFTVNKDGWTLVNAGYVITEGYEFLDENNIAYTISSGTDTLTSSNAGEAYLQSDTYFVKMGTNNQLKITVRAKVNRASVVFGTSVNTIDVPYTKVRIMVKYGNLYLQGNGTWGTDLNTLVFLTSEFNKYVDYEIVAKQPTTGTPVSGMDFNVRVYHSYIFHAQFQTQADLEAFPTWDTVNQTVPIGYKTELKVTGGTFDYIHYYELEENTSSPSGTDIIRPDDYAFGNERQWILKAKRAIVVISGTDVFSMAIDRIKVEYLTDGKSPIDNIVRTIQGENSNPLILEKELILGSASSLIVTEVSLGIDLGVFFPSGGLAITTTNTLSADLIYAGFLRNAIGEGYDNFARDGVSESDKLHGILLKSYALQYRKSWRLLRGSIYAKEFFGLINTARNVNDSNRIYLPMGLSLDDKMCTWSGEFLELKNIGGDSDGSGTSPFTSAFTIGFGSSGFN